ncbi:MAG: hypothetical protein JZU50_04555 [Desulfobulbaceae bacterium]|jgi:hypothetical protein|nr:hypothetical protein [Desulfobulbaceae bacterium]
MKPIGDLVSEINGTVYESFAPSFLNVSKPGHFPVSPSSFQGTGLQESVGAVSEDELSFDEEGGLTFGDDDEIVLADDSEDLVMDLDDFSALSPRQELALDLNEARGEIHVQPPALDFGDLDISDLAPPSLKESMGPVASQPFLEELELAQAEPVAVLSVNAPAQQKLPAVKATGLEDLQVNGLDLEAPAKSVAGSATGKRYFPSVKTGTALDSFDVDLGDLFAENKK